MAFISLQSLRRYGGLWELSTYSKLQDKQRVKILNIEVVSLILKSKEMESMQLRLITFKPHGVFSKAIELDEIICQNFFFETVFLCEVVAALELAL